MNTEIFDLGKIGITLGYEYNDEVIYEKLTIVLYKGKSYISTKTTKGVSPEQDVKTWQLVAEAKDAYHMLIDAGKTTLTEKEFLEQLVDATKGRYIVQGNIINAADEEDLTVEHSDLLGIDTLKLANRPSTDGMGYVILRKNKSFAEQVTKENTIYEIRYAFDLSGTEVTIPEDCVLKFEGGKIKNGSVIFHNTSFINSPCFESCVYSGDIKAQNIYDEWFKSDDDTELMKWLVVQTANNSTKLFLSKDYVVNFSNQINIYLENKSFSIIGNNHTIYNSYIHKKSASRYFILAKECHDIYVENLYFEDLHNDANSLLLTPEGEEKPNWTGGTSAFRMCGDTNNVTIINGKCKNIDSYLFCGIDPHGDSDVENNYVVDGFTNFKIEVDAYNSCYPVAIFVGHNIDITVKGRYVHRCCRLQGVRNCNAKVYGAYASSPVILLLQESVGYTDHTYTTPKFHPCSNIKADIVSLYEEEHIGGPWYDNAFQIKCYKKSSLETSIIYGLRTEKYLWENININIEGMFHTGVVIWPYTQTDLNDVYNVTIHCNTTNSIHVNYSLEDVGKKVSEFAICNIKIINSYISSLRLNLTDKSTFECLNTTVKNLINNSDFPIVINNKTIGYTGTGNHLTKEDLQYANIISDDEFNFIKNENVFELKKQLYQYPSKSLILIKERTIEGAVRKNIKINLSASNLLDGNIKTIYIYNPVDTRAIINLKGTPTPNFLGCGSPMFLDTKTLIKIIVLKANDNVYVIAERINQTMFLRNGGVSSVFSYTVGDRYYNIAQEKPYYLSSTKDSWRESDGEVAGIRRNGTTSERPVPINIGFMFFDTSLNPPRPIYWKGNGHWVDARGEEV